MMMPLHAVVPAVEVQCAALGEQQGHERAEERDVDQGEDRRRGVLDVAVERRDAAATAWSPGR